MERILIVEDEAGIASFVKLELLHEGYEVQVAEDGRTALELFQQEQWDLVLLDIMLPGINGLEVLRRIRKTSSVPVILLTARGDTMDRVMGLDAGADDYLPKPFAIEELLARIRSLLRRKTAWSGSVEVAVHSKAAGVVEEVLTCGAITLNPKSCTVTLAGQELSLTKTEYQLLHCFIPDICAELADEDSGMFIDIDTRWSELIGGDFANMTRPVKVQNRVLYVEVRHVLLLRELSPSADIFLQQINSRREGPPCTELRFVPPGGARR